MIDRYSRRRDLALCGLLLLAIGAVYGQTAQYDFVNFDDPLSVYQNAHVSAGLTSEGVARAFTHPHASSWVPLTCLSQMLDCQIFGLWAGGHHLTNAALHAATAVLLFLLLKKMTGQTWPSALVAALFAIHPTQVEAVAWVTARKDVLCGLFFVLTLWAYFRYAQQPFSLMRYLAVINLFCLGMMAKPMLVTLPVVLLLLDYWPLGRFRPPRTTADGDCGQCLRPENARLAGQRARLLVLEKLPLLAVAAIFSLMALWAQGEALKANERYPLLWRIGNASLACVGYLGHFVCPSGLALPYPRLSLELPWHEVLAAALLLATITAVALLCRRRRPYLFVGWLWYLVTLLPVIGLVQFGAQTVADRFTYLPQVGLAIAIAWWAADVCATGRPSIALRRWACGSIAVTAVGILAACAWRQTTFWEDSETLFTHTLECNWQNAMAHHQLGIALSDWGFNDAAMAHFREVRKLEPRYVIGMSHLRTPLTPSELATKTATHYRRAVDRDPTDSESRRRLAWLLATCPSKSRRNGTEAIELVQQAIRLAGAERPKTLDTLAAAYAEAGRFSEALPAARQALELARQQGSQQLAADIALRIAGYEIGKPFREELPADRAGD